MNFNAHSWIYKRVVRVHGYTFGLSPNKPGALYLDAVEAILSKLSQNQARKAHDTFMLKNIMDRYEQRLLCPEWQFIEEQVTALFGGEARVLINAMHADQATVGWVRDDGDFEVLAVFVQSALNEGVTDLEFDCMVWSFIDMMNEKLEVSDVCGLCRADVPEILFLDDAV